MFAAVDLGSNSFRLHIGVHDGERIRIVNSAREPVRLGAGLDGRGNLTQRAIQNALACLHRFSQVLNATPLSAVRVVATNTVRVAKNASSFVPLFEKAIGYPIEVISGEEEGRLIYMGVASTLNAPSERRLVIDIGGGSTELVLGHGSDIEEVESFSIGTVPITNRFFNSDKISAVAFDEAVLAARSVFEDGLAPFHPKFWDCAYGSSGTMRTLAEIIAANALGDGDLSLKSLLALRDVMIASGRASKIALEGIRPERLSVILGGLPVLIGLCEALGVKSMQSIEAGLRMGVLWDLYLRERKKDRRQESIKRFMKRFGVDDSRAAKASSNALVFYRQLADDNGAIGKLLGWAGKIHEVGMAVSHTGFHKHGAYLALHADLPGFTSQEQHILSILLLAQKGNLRKVQDALAEPEIAKAILALRLGTIFMHARIDPAIETTRLRLRTRIELEISSQLLANHPTLSYWLSKEQSAWEEMGASFQLRATAG
jgi:exopolyphosphatase/guanosine-5'-triphosphate,3'-diphosphate pyrophosphatase